MGDVEAGEGIGHMMGQKEDRDARALLARLPAATCDLQDARAAANAEVVSVLRDLERRLLDGLGGERLRGLPCLTPNWEAPFYGVRLRGTISAFLPNDGRSVLVLSDHGQICIARRDPENFDGATLHPIVEPAADEDMRAQDLSEATAAIAWALREHLHRAGASLARYRSISELATRLRLALGH